MAEVNLTIQVITIKTECDLSKCEACEDTIYTKNNQFAMKANGKIIPLEVKLCNSCFDLTGRQ